MKYKNGYPPQSAEELKALIDNRTKKTELRIEALEHVLKREKFFKRELIRLTKETVEADRNKKSKENEKTINKKIQRK